MELPQALDHSLQYLRKGRKALLHVSPVGSIAKEKKDNFISAMRQLLTPIVNNLRIVQVGFANSENSTWTLLGNVSCMTSQN